MVGRKPTEGYTKLHEYMRGWKRGAHGGALNDGEKKLPAIVEGYEAGRAAATKVWVEQRDRLGVTSEELNAGLLR